jgi:hypothetical protein
MMNHDDTYDGAVSDLCSAPPGERDRAIREVCERIAAAAQRAEPKSPDERRRDAPPPAPTGVGPTRPSPVWVAPPAGAAPGQAPAPVPTRPVAQVPAFLKETLPLPPAEGDVTPFRPAPPAPPPQRRAAPPTVQSRVRGIGETAGVCDDPSRMAVTPPADLPSLTLRQFASLCAELHFRPDQRSAILERYTVRDEAVYAALDAHWRRERAARPEARTAFADDFASYLAWLHAHRA